MKKSSSLNGRKGKRCRNEQSPEHIGDIHENTSPESPIHVVTPWQSSPQEPFGLKSQSLLKDLLYPLSPREFMTKHFRQSAVHVQGGFSNEGNHNRYQPLIEDGMYNLNTSELVKDTSSDSVFVWLASNSDSETTGKESAKKNRYDSPLIQSIEIPDANAALALHQSTGSHALYCRAPPAVEQVLVAKLLRDTGLGCGQYDPTGESLTSLARGEVEMFLTAKAGGITDWHYDFQENFTLQLSGVKRWTLRRGTVAHPLRACTPHYRAPDVVESQLKAAHLTSPHFSFDRPTAAEDPHNAVGPTKVAVLRPGDALYFPAGMWHRIQVLEPGVSINVSLMATNYATLACQALQHHLLCRDDWRQAVVHNPDAGIDARRHLDELLRDLPQIVDEFRRQGGAGAILPPILLHPPDLQDPSGEDGGDEDGNDDQDTMAKRPKSNGKEQDGSDDEELEVEESGMPIGEDAENASWGGVSMEGEDSNIVSAYEFQYPASVIRPCPMDTESTVKLLKTHRLIRNPLASLIRLDEVTGYYNRRMHNKDSEQDKNSFVLNVNYAGVESHESAVRVVLRDDPEMKFLDHLRKNTFYAGTIGEKLAKQVAEGSPNLVHCLLYYGFFVMVPKSG